MQSIKEQVDKIKGMTNLSKNTRNLLITKVYNDARKGPLYVLNDKGVPVNKYNGLRVEDDFEYDGEMAL